MKREDIAVGDEVIVHGQPKGSTRPGVVVRVGRTLVDIRSTSYGIESFYLSNQTAKSHWFGSFQTKQQAADAAVRRAIVDRLKAHGLEWRLGFHPGDDWPTDALDALATTADAVHSLMP